MDGNTLFEKVNSFYEARNINVRNIQAFMLQKKGRAHHQKYNLTVERFYQINIFYTIIYYQLQ